MAVASNFPAIRPSLNLDFANARALDPRITFSRASAATYYDGKTVAKAEENLLLNSAILATQSVTTRAEPYTLSFIGTGTVTLSGTSTAGPLVGTGAANRVSLTFTPTSGTLTLTVTGAVEQAQLEARSVATAYAPTTTQPITNYVPVLQTAPAGVPRFDHNPVTGESLGLLVEEQRTNLLLRSQDFSYAVWQGTGSALALAGIAPDGTLSSYKLSEDTSSAVHYKYQGLASTLGTNVYTLSAYVKAAGRSRVQLWSASGSPRFSARFDLAAKTAVNLANVGTASVISSSITEVGNDWYRISVTGTTGTDNVLGINIFLDNGSNHVYQGDGYSGVYIWGVQVEAGTFPTSYIKTEASQVTRAADSAAMTGANFSSWYRQDEGTLFANYVQGLSQVNQAVFSVSNISNSSNITLYSDSQVTSGLVPTFVVTNNSAVQVFINYADSGKRDNKLICAYSFNNFASSMNGSTASVDVLGEVPAVDQAWIGRTLTKFSERIVTSWRTGTRYAQRTI